MDARIKSGHDDRGYPDLCIILQRFSVLTGWRIELPRYAIVVETDAPSTGIWVPERPGCTTMGKTIDEALANLAEAMELWSEGRQLPKARGVAEIRRLPDVAADLEAGAVLMLVPFLRESG